MQIEGDQVAALTGKLKLMVNKADLKETDKHVMVNNADLTETDKLTSCVQRRAHTPRGARLLATGSSAPQQSSPLTHGAHGACFVRGAGGCGTRGS